MTKKYIKLGIIVLVLIGVCVWEELAVNTYLSEIDKMVSNIQTVALQSENINTSEILMLVENLEEQWKKKENTLCVIVNHEDVEEIGCEISRLKGAIVATQYEDFLITLSIIRFYTESFNQSMGMSLQNLLWKKENYKKYYNFNFQILNFIFKKFINSINNTLI